ncbi:MAG: TlyA family RNA methyltransferase [Clostridia bacterium]|nr:TlyA family RNA methyltransferase [Clostridia bacterium]
MDDKMRADIALFKRNLVSSREKAQSLIAAGLVSLNGKVLAKPSVKVSDEDELTVCGFEHPYVSRGGLKLEKALKSFDLNPTGMICMDIGASTGGFTDVLLQNGAQHVYAIDVGSGQLDAGLLKDSRVTNMEHINARALSGDMFPVQPTLAVMDVSFISIKLILPSAFQVLGEKGRMISLIKPQFEAGREYIGKGGIVAKPTVHAQVLSEITSFVPTLGWRVQALDFSPISGGDGNIEFLADLVPESACTGSPDEKYILDLVKRAHSAVPLK